MAQNQPHHCAHSKRHKSTIVGVTEDILSYEILTRLAAKTLLRFKSVCKSWYDIISDPTFVAAHFDRTSKSPKLAIIPLQPNKQRKINIYRYEGQGNRSASLLFGQKFPDVKSCLAPVHHSNGLLLLYTPTQMIVCNPSTRKSTTLPKGSRSVLACPEVGLRAGFGFVAGSNVYKVAQYFYRSYNYEERTCSLGFEVLTFGCNSSWRITAEDPPYPIKIRSCAVSAGGAIYFEIDNSLHTSSPEFILSFDLRDEKFAVVPPPLRFQSPHGSCLLTEQENSTPYFLAKVDNSLCFGTRCLEEDRLEIWMYESCTRRGWVHSFTIKFPNRPEFLSLVTVRNGKLLLEVDDGEDKLVWFDPQSRTLETMVRIAGDLSYHNRGCPSRFGENCFFQVVSYVESMAAVKPGGKIEL